MTALERAARPLVPTVAWELLPPTGPCVRLVGTLTLQAPRPVPLATVDDLGAASGQPVHGAVACALRPPGASALQGLGLWLAVCAARGPSAWVASERCAHLAPPAPGALGQTNPTLRALGYVPQDTIPLLERRHACPAQVCDTACPLYCRMLHLTLLVVAWYGAGSIAFKK
jgi:hypothetical protein